MNNLYIKIARQLYSKLLLALNIRYLSNKVQIMLQQQWGRNYQQMTDQKKISFNHVLNTILQHIQNAIKKITNNIQYQDWLVKIINNDNQIFSNIYYYSQQQDYINQIKKLLQDYDTVKIYQQDKTFKNINHFKNLQQFKDYVSEALSKYNNAISNKNKKKDISKLFHKYGTYGTYDIYNISQDDKYNFQTIYGENGYKCAWCVTKKDQHYFDSYTEEGQLFLITYSNSSKPFALFFMKYDKSIQLRDIHNDAFQADDSLSQFIIHSLETYETYQPYIFNDKLQNIISPNIYENLIVNSLQNIENYYKTWNRLLADLFYFKLKKQNQEKLLLKWINNSNLKFIDYLVQQNYITFNDLTQEIINIAKNNYNSLFLTLAIYDENLTQQQQQKLINHYIMNETNFGANSNFRKFFYRFNLTYQQFLHICNHLNNNQKMYFMKQANLEPNDKDKICKFIAQFLNKQYESGMDIEWFNKIKNSENLNLNNKEQEIKKHLSQLIK